MKAVVWDSVKGLLLVTGDAKKRIGKKQAAAERYNASTLKKLDDLQKKKAKCEAERLPTWISSWRTIWIRKCTRKGVERFSGATELDQKTVDALIEKVLVYDPEHVEI